MTLPADLTRRRFLRAAASCGLAVSACAGCAATRPFLRAELEAGLARLPLLALRYDEANIVYIPQLGASVAVNFVPTAATKTTDSERETNETPAGTWQTILLVCTHRGCNVAPHARGYRCPCHDSYFDTAGAVLQGPADAPLPQIDTDADGVTLTLVLRPE